MTQLLAGLRVVELVGALGDACTRLLASLGAEVTRVDRMEQALAQLDSADVLVEQQAAGAGDMLSPESLRRRNARLIHATITPFGSHGPYAQFRGGELVCSAMGGVLRMVGEPDRAPVKEALDACLFHAQAATAAAVMLAYYEREHSGLGQHIDVSVQEVAASRLTNALVLWQFDRRLLERSGDKLRYGRAAVRCIWPLRDGYAFHTLMSGRFGAPANAALSDWLDELGYDNPLREVDWLSYDRSALPQTTRERWEAALERFFAERSKAELAAEGRRRGINASVLQEPGDVLRDPQLAARGFWQLVERAGRTRQTPGPFVHVQLAAAVGGGARRPRRPPGANALGGVNVLDLSWALVGSLTTKALGDHGACVVKLESARRPCLSRLDVQVSRSSAASLDDKPWFAQLNTSKLGLRLDLKHPRALEVLEPLIAWADVVVENFSPGTLDKLGLGYAALSQRKPELIMISASAYGQTGPLRESWGVDGTSAALCSRMLSTGWPDRGPVLPGALPYADVVVPQVMVASLAAALVQRLRTGRGCYIDASMYEISAQQMIRALEGWQLGAAFRRVGNRDPDVWHQGVYPARGVDRWIAISLYSRADYALLCQRFGGSWPEPQDLELDDAARDRLDARLSEFTREHAAHALMFELQGLGIAAGVVQDIEELVERDPQLRLRPAWVTLDHAQLGPFDHQCTPYHLERSVARLTPAPGLGEHTEHVCRDLLGLSPEQIASLRAAGLFT